MKSKDFIKWVARFQTVPDLMAKMPKGHVVHYGNGRFGEELERFMLQQTSFSLSEVVNKARELLKEDSK